ncbi:MAG TPA: iron-containing redox enzyme family protein [Longimicrobium sp.]
MSRIDAEWLSGLEEWELGAVVLNYRYFVHRFPQWLALTIGNSSDERVRQLLLPNLVEEAGTFQGAPSHLNLLDALIVSCGCELDEFTPLDSTIQSEQWFYDVTHDGITEYALAALGPGTEDVSQDFLVPFETAIRSIYGIRADYRYFDAHRPSVEEHHGNDIRLALSLLEGSSNDPANFTNRVRTAASNAIHTHQTFWDGLRTFLRRGYINV